MYNTLIFREQTCIDIQSPAGRFSTKTFYCVDTEAPTKNPTGTQTTAPTATPTNFPTSADPTTAAPTANPTITPTGFPTNEQVTACSPNPCSNDGTCVGAGACTCFRPFTGRICEEIAEVLARFLTWIILAFLFASLHIPLGLVLAATDSNGAPFHYLCY